MLISRGVSGEQTGFVRGAIAAVVVLACVTASAATLNGRVVKVADGDTITVLVTIVQHKIRLNRIDAPEKGQAFGNVSRQHLASFVAGKDVEVEWEKKDKYGRLLGTVWVDVPAGGTNAAVRTDINLQMVKDGLAWHYKHFDNTKSYADAETAARAAKRGLWKDPNPVPPYEFRKSKKEKK
jgi:endonuclease YncB( thermonuclease family)